MNIAYISADFGVPFFGYKGASVHVRELVAALSQAGHSVSVISPAIEDKGHRGEWAKRNLSALPMLSDLTVAFASADNNVRLFPVYPPQEHLFQGRPAIDDFEEFLDAKTRIRQELRNLFYNSVLYNRALDYLLLSHVDFIYERYALFGYAGIRLARELGVPHILEVNAPLAYEQEKMRGLEMKALALAAERRIFCETDLVVVVSQTLKAFVEACGVPASRIRILPNAINPELFVADGDGKSVRTRYELDGKRVIGFVGSLKSWHGTETLLEAFHKLQTTDANTHLLIVGDGPERQKLEQHVEVNGLGSTVTFTGNVPHEDIPHYIAAMDVTAAPYVPNENFYFSPIKIFEYMVMGKPVIAGRIGQVEEVIVDGETGVLYEPGNIAQLTAGLAKLTGDAQFSHHLGKNARAWVEKERTWDNNARQVVEVVWKLVETKRSAERSAKNVIRHILDA
jgi:glycosyltransferase involved in cell wall biosynthesis